MPLPLEDAFRSFAANPRSPVDGALLVAQIVHPATDVAWCRRELGQLATQAGTAATANGLIQSLHAYGFKGATDYYAADNSVLEYVLRQRQGIPISLAMVIVGTAEQLALPAVGINFPGHFLVDISGELIDPFTMALLDPQERRLRLAACGVPEAQALRIASPVDVVLRMLNNLRGLAVARRDALQALQFADYQMLLTSDPFPLHLARLELLREVGAASMLQRELEQAIALAPDPEIRGELEELLRKVGATRPTLH